LKLAGGSAGCSVEQSDLRAREPHGAVGRISYAGERAESLTPRFRQDADRSVGQRDARASLTQRRQQLGQGSARVTERGAAAQLEPVDAARDLEIEIAGGPDATFLGLDGPA
jgi:hypothetical protein